MPQVPPDSSPSCLRSCVARVVEALAVLMVFACGSREATYVEYRARYECDFLLECYPDRFEQSCQPCADDLECPLGACNRSLGRCRTSSGPTDMTGETNAPCAHADECGGLVCKTRFESREHCLDFQYGRDANDRMQMCTYDEDAGRECLRLLRDRSCADARPPICDHVYDVCEM